jgi:uncharacterized protein YkwD
MKNNIIFIILISLLFSSYNINRVSDKACVSAEEQKLYDLIMKYRKSKKLPAIPLSVSLTYVAQTHSKDLSVHHPDKASGCNGHSWSDKGKWTSCCYTPDHAQKECMWNKPQELTSYESSGYEIAFGGSSTGPIKFEAKAENSIDAWKKSKSHNAVMINEGIWKDQEWKAIGIGIYKDYATVWFGTQTDTEGKPGKCK